ncbi:MAG: sigma-54-dependent Fis family transcriptional regulator [Bdellovibrionales bacterium]|nr:sigma-54-dependent Fis family transcriptional regulator [Bdellovibrionales bacterium]
MTEIITADRRMRELIQLATTVAQSKATVLIQGESGTGKELVAALIHEKSNRAGRPFVAINCAAIPDNLLESELFGYERGAFTGAVNSHAGKFELANGGTILLDEVSEMDVRLQAKLLRVIQEGQVDRIGGKKPIHVDVRIVATTNRNLTDAVRDGTFREDLYYRLNVVNFSLPSLRERTGDVRLLASYFLQIYARRNDRFLAGFTDEALQIMDSHSWPGNIRELENVVERSVITATGERVSARDLQILTRAGTPSSTIDLAEAPSNTSWSPGQTLDEIERRVIMDALSYHKGNRTHTARALGISIRTLRNKLADFRKMGIYL